MVINAKYDIGQKVFVIDTKTGDAYERCFVLEVETITIWMDGSIKYNAIYGGGGAYGYFEECDAFATKEEAMRRLEEFGGRRESTASWSK